MQDQETPEWSLIEIRASGKEKCVKIPIVLKGNGDIEVPSRTKVKRKECVCWKCNKDDWSVVFPAGSPFAGGKSEFGPDDPCGTIAEDADLDLYKYDVTIETVTEDPYLDVGA